MMNPPLSGIHARSRFHYRTLDAPAGAFHRSAAPTPHHGALRRAIEALQPHQSAIQPRGTERVFAERGIKYVFLGKELGARSEDPRVSEGESAV